MVNVAILGYGIVGSGVAEVIKENAQVISNKIGDEVAIKYILDKRTFPDSEYHNIITNDFSIILDDPSVSVIVETMGGLHPSFDYTKAALEAGKNVVTSNKEVVATCGAELLDIALRMNVHYMFEASVGGGIPIIRPIHQCLAANEIGSVTGILNGTTNYILTQMVRNNKSFDSALSEAQEKGYAERDPSADLDGIDTCRKICILSSLAFGRQVPPSKVFTKGIRTVTMRDVQLADKADCVIRLLGSARRSGNALDISVEPCFLNRSNPLSNVEDVYNGIQVTGNAIGDVMFYGRGAGKLPTASAVVADVIDCIKNIRRGISWESSDGSFVMERGETTASFFVHLRGQIIPDFVGEVRVIEKIGGEVSFITPIGRIAEIEAAIKASGAEVLSMMRYIE